MPDCIGEIGQVELGLDFGHAFALAQARERVVTLAGTGAGSDTDTQPVVLNEVLGTKFKVVTGYLGTQETALAVERGEVDGRCGF